jgi:hypothetical protein
VRSHNPDNGPVPHHLSDAEDTTRLERPERARTTQERLEADIIDALESSPEGTTRNEIVATVAADLGFGRTKALGAVRDAGFGKNH